MSQSVSNIDWVRPPQQKRSHQSLERILDAAEEIVAEKGFECATVTEIVQKAKSSVGVFYSRFGEKTALLGCLHERFCDQALATIDVVLDPNRWEGATVAEILNELIPFLVNIYCKRKGLIRAFILYRDSETSFAEKWIPLNDHLSKRLRELLLDRHDAIDHPDPALAIDFGLNMVLSILDRVTLLNSSGSMLALENERLPVELTRMFLGYLGIRSTAIDR